MAKFMGTALVVVGNTTLSGFDQDQIDHFWALGFSVTVVAHDDAFIATDSNLEAFTVVYYSESCSSATLGTSGRDAAVGLGVGQGGSLGNLDMATDSADVAGSDADSAQPQTNHAAGAGLAGNASGGFDVTITTSNKQLRHADSASSGAVNVFEMNGFDHGIAVWPTGSDLTTGTANGPRGFLGHVRQDDSPDESGGLVLNDTGWAIWDSVILWLAEETLATDRQLVYPVEEITETGSWAGTVTDIDDEVPSVSSPYASGNASGNLVFKLGLVADPQDAMLHVLSVAHRRSAAGDTPTLTFQLRQDYVNESTLGTEIASWTGKIDGQNGWGGDAFQLTPAQIGNIDYSKELFVRVIYVVGGNSEMELANIRFLTNAQPLVTLVHFEHYLSEDAGSPGDNQNPTDVALSSTLRTLANDLDVLVIIGGGARLDDPPPGMENGTAYGSADWSTMVYAVHSTTGGSLGSWIKLTDESALPTDVTVGTGQNRAMGFGVYLLRNVDVSLIEEWDDESSSDPTFAEDATEISVTSANALILATTNNSGDFTSDTTPLTVGPWTEDGQFYTDWTVDSWGVVGHVYKAKSGALPQQDLHTTGVSDTPVTMSFPAAVVVPGVPPKYDLNVYHRSQRRRGSQVF